MRLASYLVTSADDLKQRVVKLSVHASAALGGIVDSKTSPFSQVVEEVAAELKALHPHQVVSLGALIEIGVGLCRHRSILFKYLCDHMHRLPAEWGLTAGGDAVPGAIPCQLVRGIHAAADGSGDIENHMWNVVRIGDKSFVVDVMQHPRQLLPVDSKEAQFYQRTILASAEAQVCLLLAPFCLLCSSLCLLTAWGGVAATRQQ